MLIGTQEGAEGVLGEPPISLCQNTISPKMEPRETLIGIAREELGVQERTGHNDGDRIAEYLRYTLLGEGHEWCAAFVSWCFGRAGFVEPRTPWSPALFPQQRLLRRVEEAQAGDVAGFWVREKGRIGHVGLVEVGVGLERGINDPAGSDSYLITIEGNKANAVRRVRRHVKTIYVVSDWISDNATLGGGRKGGVR